MSVEQKSAKSIAESIILLIFFEKIIIIKYSNLNLNLNLDLNLGLDLNSIKVWIWIEVEFERN